ncbi:hypothetical protein, partial [Catellatospora sp. NPDC049609]|uniref:hypothetical protein n=1 Tax=Catellatospora sp. NPDC049609 TaxID=3155505 RepID=UPI00342D7475
GDKAWLQAGTGGYQQFPLTAAAQVYDPSARPDPHSGCCCLSVEYAKPGQPRRARGGRRSRVVRAGRLGQSLAFRPAMGYAQAPVPVQAVSPKPPGPPSTCSRPSNLAAGPDSRQAFASCIDDLIGRRAYDLFLCRR